MAMSVMKFSNNNKIKQQEEMICLYPINKEPVNVRFLFASIVCHLEGIGEDRNLIAQIASYSNCVNRFLI